MEHDVTKESRRHVSHGSHQKEIKTLTRPLLKARKNAYLFLKTRPSYLLQPPLQHNIIVCRSSSPQVCTNVQPSHRGHSSTEISTRTTETAEAHRSRGARLQDTYINSILIIQTGTHSVPQGVFLAPTL